MSLATASGYPQYADAAIKYIPELFAPNLLLHYYDASTLAAIANTEYEGIISEMGDTVWVRTQPELVWSPYVKGAITRGSAPSAAPIKLLIDNGRSYSFPVNDVDEKQADIVLSEGFLKNSGDSLKATVDKAVYAAIYADADADNQGAAAGKLTKGYNLGSVSAPLAITKANVVQVVLAAMACLDEQTTPDDDRFFLMPPFFRYLGMSSELANASVMGNGESAVRNGRLGQIDRATLYSTNCLTAVTVSGKQCFHMLAGHKSAVTYAMQLVKNRAIDNPDDFGKLYEGLAVFGWKTIRPAQLVHVIGYMG